MNKNKFIRLLFTLHHYAGLIAGIFFTLLGLSGAALVFMKEQDEWLNKKIVTVNIQPSKLSLDSMYHIIAATREHIRGMALMNPAAPPGRAYDFRLYENDGKLSTYDLAIISIDPYTGRILRQGRYDELSSGFMQWLYQFHFSFHWGMPGTALTALFGLVMLLSVITGLIVYRKFVGKVLTFRMKISFNNWRVGASGLHRVIGVWSLLFNLAIFFTGFWMNIFAFDKKVWQKQLTAEKPNTLFTASADAMLATGAAALPFTHVTYVYLPTQPGRDFSVSGELTGDNAIFGSRNTVSIDTHTGGIKKVFRISSAGFAEKLDASTGPLHFGTWGGLPVKIMYVFIGLTPGILSVTGFMLWWRRKAKPARRPVTYYGIS